MVVDYLDFVVKTIIPNCLMLFDSLIITEGVSWLGLTVAVTLLSIAIGSILMRV